MGMQLLSAWSETEELAKSTINLELEAALIEEATIKPQTEECFWASLAMLLLVENGEELESSVGREWCRREQGGKGTKLDELGTVGEELETAGEAVESTIKPFCEEKKVKRLIT